MSNGFESDEGLVRIVDKITKTDPWGSSTTEYIPRLMTLTEVQGRDINKQAGKPVIEIIGTTEVPQSRKK